MAETSEEFWARHKRERQEATEWGEYCSRCGKWIFRWRYPGYLQECNDCKNISKPEDLDHDKFLRCPKCRHTFDAREDGPSGIFEEGSNGVMCPECEHDFEVETTVSYRFTSPALGASGDEEDSEG